MGQDFRGFSGPAGGGGQRFNPFTTPDAAGPVSGTAHLVTSPADRIDVEQTLNLSLTPPVSGLISQDLRYVNVKNQTGRTLHVFYEYHTRTNDGQWQWFPPDGRPLTFDLSSGAYVYLRDKNWRVNADRIKIWAESPEGQVMERFRHEPLVVVPEVNVNGQQVYNTPRMGSYNLTFR